jgi:hypothetical protein
MIRIATRMSSLLYLYLCLIKNRRVQYKNINMCALNTSRVGARVMDWYYIIPMWWILSFIG